MFFIFRSNVEMQSLIRFPPVIEKNCDFLLRLHSSLIYDDNDDDVDDYDDMLQDRKKHRTTVLLVRNKKRTEINVETIITVCCRPLII